MYYISGDANQSIHLVAGEGLEAYLPLSDMIDVYAEVDRLSKRLSKMQEEFDRLAARLRSPKVRTKFMFVISFNSTLILDTQKS